MQKNLVARKQIENKRSEKKRQEESKEENGKATENEEHTEENKKKRYRISKKTKKCEVERQRTQGIEEYLIEAMRA